METIRVCSEVLIVPVFVKYDRFDRFVVPLAQIDDDKLIAWLEATLLSFIRTYLSSGISNADQSEAIATDVVCGMRVHRDGAAAVHDHAGHRYFFCSHACKEEFAADPARYVTIVTL